MRKLTKAERLRQSQLEKQLAREGLAVLGGNGSIGKTTPGLNSKGVGFVSLDSSGDDGPFNASVMFEVESMRDFSSPAPPSVADTPTGSYFRRFGQLVEEHHVHDKNYKLLRAYADCGFVGKARRMAGWPPRLGERAKKTIRRFCARHGIPVNPFAARSTRKVAYKGEYEQDPLLCYTCPRTSLGRHSKHGPPLPPTLSHARPNQHPPVSGQRPPVRNRLNAQDADKVKRVRKRPPARSVKSVNRANPSCVHYGSRDPE